jgi:acyl carrier protein
MNISTEERVRSIIAKHLNIDISKVHLESTFAKDLGADSINQVEMIMALEDEFSIEIPDHVAETILKVGDAIKYVEEQLNNNNA